MSNQENANSKLVKDIRGIVQDVVNPRFDAIDSDISNVQEELKAHRAETSTILNKILHALQLK